MGSIHAPKQLTRRLTRVLEFLRERGLAGVTTMEAQNRCGICGSVAFRELRAMGYDVECRHVSTNKREGTRTYRYILRENGQRELFSS